MALAGCALLSLAALVSWDVAPSVFPPRVHDLLGALPLALVGLAYLAHQSSRRASVGELWKALLLALAFFSWAANQFWPDIPQAPLLNDVAIVLFVLDVVITMIAARVTVPDRASR